MATDLVAVALVLVVVLIVLLSFGCCYIHNVSCSIFISISSAKPIPANHWELDGEERTSVTIRQPSPIFH